MTIIEIRTKDLLDGHLEVCFEYPSAKGCIYVPSKATEKEINTKVKAEINRLLTIKNIIPSYREVDIEL